MGKLLLVLVFIIIILFIFLNKNKNIGNINKVKRYRNIIFIVIIVGALFLLATSGRFIIPQLMQVFKMFLPLITKLIGI